MICDKCKKDVFMVGMGTDVSELGYFCLCRNCYFQILDEEEKAKIKKILICGTRKKGYDLLVRVRLDKLKDELKNFQIIEGCCPDSADAYSEKWAIENAININHFPSNSGNYLKRNIEMVNFADEVIAFWDGFSYGTAHTIAQAVKRGIKVEIINLKEEKQEK